MQWLNELPFGDYRVVQIGFLAACAIAALVVLAIVYRLVFAHRLRVPGSRTRQPRLGLVDAFSLDGQRQLVLVRRDNVEHLVMIGGPNDVLVESQINRALPQVRDNVPATPPQTLAAAQVRRAEPVAVGPAASAPAPKVASEAVSPAAAPAAEARASRPQSSVPAASSPAFSSTAAVSDAAPQARTPAAPATTSAPGAADPKVDPARSARESPAQPRPALARASMPPPITPPGGPSRANLVRTADDGQRGPSSASPAPARSSDAPPAPAQGTTQPAVAPTKPEARPAPGGARASAPPVATSAPGSRVAKPEPPAARAVSRGTDVSALAQGAGQASTDKPPPKPNDPFSGLDSLEEEMARLLGRDKPGG